MDNNPHAGMDNGGGDMDNNLHDGMDNDGDDMDNNSPGMDDDKGIVFPCVRPPFPLEFLIRICVQYLKRNKINTYIPFRLLSWRGFFVYFAPPLLLGRGWPGVCEAEPPHERVRIRKESNIMNG